MEKYNLWEELQLPKLEDRICDNCKHEVGENEFSIVDACAKSPPGGLPYPTRCGGFRRTFGDYSSDVEELWEWNGKK